MSDDWRDRAVCPAVPHTTFFSDIWDDEWPHHDRPPAPDEAGLRRAREVCMRCPVRRDCLVAALDAESGDGVAKRYGLYALMTPHQRASLEKRGPWPRCSRCGQAADPAEYLMGTWTCCRVQHTVAPLPDIGDDWYERHTQLAIRVVEYLVVNVEIGESPPSAAGLAEELGARTNDVRRIYQALVQDGTLADNQGNRPRYTRIGRLAAEWQPVHLHVSPVV